MEPGKTPSPRPSRFDRPAAFLAAGILFFTVSASGSDLYLRISAGIGRLNADEINRVLSDWREGWILQAESEPGLSLEGRTERSLHIGTDFEAELLLSFSRWLALGVGAGYAYASLDEEQTLLTILQDGALYEQARPTKVGAFPVHLSIYLSLPLSGKISVYLRGGIGAVFARYVVREANRQAEAARFSFSAYENATANRLSYLGSLGLSYSFGPSFGFFAEAAARRAEVTGFEAEDSLGVGSRLYTYEEYRPDIDFWQLRTGLHPEEPAGTNVRNVREATVDLGGYSAKIGIFLKF